MACQSPRPNQLLNQLINQLIYQLTKQLLNPLVDLDFFSLHSGSYCNFSYKHMYIQPHISVRRKKCTCSGHCTFSVHMIIHLFQDIPAFHDI
jgi:hypothetical protein